jgi:signal transduction histidine kinase/ActR/RegA family two-component response regulator
MVFFVTMLWFREVSHDASEQAMREFNDYGISLMSERGISLDKAEGADNIAILESKIAQVNDSLLRNSVIQMAIILIALYIMFNIYTSMSKRERKMEVEKIKAEENSKAKSIFLSNMSHDIRTPMNAIIGYTELTRGIDNLPEEAKNNLEKIDYSSKHLLSLINDVLDMSCIESGKMKLEPVPSDLKQIFKEVYTIFEPQMKGKNIEFTLDTEGIEDRYVLCDANRINRVLLNLVSNAFKFTPENGKVTVTLKQTGKAAGSGNYRISVKDNGMGMSPEFCKTVFEAYTREKSASKIQGTGLGMAITKSIVDLSGGNIRVESEKGKGSEFIIDLTFDFVSEEEYLKTHKSSETDKTVDYSELTVLLVDDVLLNREIASKILKKFGFKVETADNGKIALDKVASSEPGTYDLILMDIQMPVMNGYEASKEIRAINDSALSSIPIVAMSANAFAEDVQKSRESGMNGHIAKPIEVEKMMETINEVLGM